jgi:hypothetical protein
MADLWGGAFGSLPDGAEPAAWLEQNGPALRDRRFLGLFDGPRLVGMARYHDMPQYWHGRTVFPRTHCGPSLRDETSLRYGLSEPRNYFYLAGDGVLAYTWRQPRNPSLRIQMTLIGLVL